MFFKKCKHENIQTITNIYGDPINMFGCRSLSNCIDCGKIFKGGLDLNCKKGNRFNYKEFHLMAESLEEVSDGKYTFKELYEREAKLFSLICNLKSDVSWKTLNCENVISDKNYFIVGIEFEEKMYLRYFDKKYWNIFNIKEIEKIPKKNFICNEEVDDLINMITGLR